VPRRDSAQCGWFDLAATARAVLDRFARRSVGHAIATVALKAEDAPRVRIRNAGSGLLVADALLLESQARWNDGSAVTSVTLDPMDAIVLHRTSGGCP
jgi:hypothetical protein